MPQYHKHCSQSQQLDQRYFGQCKYECNVHSLILSREGLVLTLSILPCPEGWISWSIPVDGLMMRRMSVLHQNSGGIGKSIPSTLQISLDRQDFSGLEKSLGRRGSISQYLPRFGGARIQSNLLTQLIATFLQNTNHVTNITIFSCWSVPTSKDILVYTQSIYHSWQHCLFVCLDSHFTLPPSFLHHLPPCEVLEILFLIPLDVDSKTIDFPAFFG